MDVSPERHIQSRPIIPIRTSNYPRQVDYVFTVLLSSVRSLAGLRKNYSNDNKAIKRWHIWATGEPLDVGGNPVITLGE